uniref:Uncharacterized protein n=1 Tax=Nelumbo nucifera TaxID=4432 RepID=A0A822XUT7_NELNU|nr:TPA_asm: hypothetical protein HUJ06_024028 [Nelumbo nucifera]
MKDVSWLTTLLFINLEQPRSSDGIIF